MRRGSIVGKQTREAVAATAALFFLAAAAQAQRAELLEPVTARAAIVVDHRTGQVLYERSADVALPPASTTKVLTAYIALRSERLNDSVLVSKYAAQMPASKIGLRAGWWMNVNDLVYATLLNSANDASVVIAEGLAGSVPMFSRVMNSTARSLGAANSHFVNPNGLPDDDHRSTARDLVRIFHHAMKVPGFREVLTTPTTTIWPVTGSSRQIALRSHNRLLGHEQVAVIGKTGYTRAAKRCFVGAATLGDREVLVAVLGSTNLWGDLRRLIDFGLSGEGEEFRPVLTEELLMASARGRKNRVARATTVGIGDVRTGSRYQVRLGSFRNKTQAKDLARRIEAHGYDVVVERLVKKGRTSSYRLTARGFSSQKEAKQAASHIRRVYRLSPQVVSVGA